MLLQKVETIHLNPMPLTIGGTILVCWQDMDWIRGKIRKVYTNHKKGYHAEVNFGSEGIRDIILSPDNYSSVMRPCESAWAIVTVPLNDPRTSPQTRGEQRVPQNAA